MPTVLHFMSDLGLGTLEDSSRSQVLPGVGQGTRTFSCNFSYGSYIRGPLEVLVEFKVQ